MGVRQVVDQLQENRRVVLGRIQVQVLRTPLQRAVGRWISRLHRYPFNPFDMLSGADAHISGASLTYST
jgi:hypothetical protein